MSAPDPMDRALADLAPRVDRLPATPPEDTDEGVLALLAEEPAPSATPSRGARVRTRRRLMVGLPAAAAAAGALVVGGSVLAPSSWLGPDPAHALDISTDGDYVVAEIVDPLADPDTYSEEFAEYGVDVDLVLKPQPEEYVGTLLSVNSTVRTMGGPSEVRVEDNPGNCRPARHGCPVTVKIPQDQQESVQIVVGRAPTEKEVWDGRSVPEDPMDLAVLEEDALTGLRVSEVRERAERAGVTIDSYFKGASFEDDPEPIKTREGRGLLTTPKDEGGGDAEDLAAEAEDLEKESAEPLSPEERADPGRDEVPGDWYVTDASEFLQDGELSLVVSPDPPDTE